MKKILLCFALCFISFAHLSGQVKNHKPRTIVTTDGEIDDVDSFIRLLLYANEFKIEGLVYSSSMWHYKGDSKGTKFTSEMAMTQKIYGEKTNLRWPGTEWMNGLIDAYAQVYPNLIKNAKGYPTAVSLKKLIHVGNIDFEGEMDKITDGSEFIKNKLLDETTEPIYLQVWGGTNTIARALKSIEEQYSKTPQWKTIYKKVCDKAIIYAILDQDATYRKYVSVNWKDIKVLYNSNQFWCLAYNWKKAVPDSLQYLLQAKFMSENIIHNHGALAKMYYSYGDGQKQAGDDEHIHGDITKIQKSQWGSFNQFDFISEGDSPSFLHLVDVGLDNLKNPEFGGWGGRLKQSATNPKRWEDGEETADFNPYSQKMDKAYGQVRWLEALQNDFAARADWCVKDFKNSNHAPTVGAYCIRPKNAIRPNNGRMQYAPTGDTINIYQLICKAHDSDGDKLNYHWWQYEEVGTYKGKIEIMNANTPLAAFKIPNDIKKGETIHIICEVSDNRKLPLTRYKRVIVQY